MPFFDLPLAELETYKPKRHELDDFDTFWEGTLADSRSHALDVEYTPVDVGLTLVDLYDVTFSGYAGQRIKGWLLIPKIQDDPLPCIVEYVGYGGGRGFPIEWLTWSNVGYAHFIMDTRGQGSEWRTGDTPDADAAGQSAQYPGVMTRGILSPETYYYRRLMTDAVRAVDAAQAHPAVDESRIVVNGASQGGGLSLAVSGLRDDLSAMMSDVPFLCHYRRATHITDKDPYNEISSYLRTHRGQVTQVFETLSYFDGVNFAARANVPGCFSVGLMDMVCPPSTVYAAYNHYAGEKTMHIYEYNEHNGGGVHQVLEQQQFLAALWG